MQYGVEVPNSVRHARELDEQNGNQLWKQAMEQELAAMEEWGVFEPAESEEELTHTHKKIIVLWTFAVNVDGRRRARLVAGGHLTSPDTEHLHSSVVRTSSVRCAIILGVANGQSFLMGDVSQAYLYADNREKIYITAGTEFGELSRRPMKIVKALYGLWSAGNSYHAYFADVLRKMGFEMCQADHDIWMKPNDGVIDLIAVHVNNFIIIAKDPQPYMAQLKKPFTIKNDGVPTFYLGGDVTVNDGTVLLGSKTYVREALAKVEKIIGRMLLKQCTPMAPDDHPELDESAPLDETGISDYQSSG